MDTYNSKVNEEVIRKVRQLTVLKMGTSEAAEFLGIAKSTVNRIKKSGFNLEEYKRQIAGDGKTKAGRKPVQQTLSLDKEDGERLSLLSLANRINRHHIEEVAFWNEVRTKLNFLHDMIKEVKNAQEVGVPSAPVAVRTGLFSKKR